MIIFVFTSYFICIHGKYITVSIQIRSYHIWKYDWTCTHTSKNEYPSMIQMGMRYVHIIIWILIYRINISLHNKLWSKIFALVNWIVFNVGMSIIIVFTQTYEWMLILFIEKILIFPFYKSIALDTNSCNYIHSSKWETFVFIGVNTSYFFKFSLPINFCEEFMTFWFLSLFAMPF